MEKRAIIWVDLVDPKLKKLLKATAVENGFKMSSLAKKIIKDFFENHQNQKGKKK